MWLFTYFDLPVETKADRKAYTDFRKALLKDGFTMLQYSVYIRHCPSMESTEAHIRRIEKALPKKGKVSILTITDKQFELVRNYWGVEHSPSICAPQQLEMF